MHKENENSYQNPEFQAFEDQRAVVAVDTSLADKTSTGKIQGTSGSVNQTLNCCEHPTIVK